MPVAMQWRRLGIPGSESALLEETTRGWLLTGTAVFLHEHQPCGLAYTIECAEDWRTLSASISGHIGVNRSDFQIKIMGDSWFVNGEDHPKVKGCIDIDIGFSPSTNLLPIRRLSLEKGESAQVKAAWLQFPSMKLTPLVQIYTRKTDTQYRYKSSESGFVCTIETNHDGFVTSYPGFWHAEGATYHAHAVGPVNSLRELSGC